jgi:phosphoglycerate dehydrogenase-like enzyme
VDARSRGLELAIPVGMREALEPRLPEGVQVTWFDDTDGAIRAAANSEVLWIGFSAFGRREDIERAIEAGPRLRWLTTPAAGVEGVPLETVERRGLALTNGAGLHAVPIAEFAVMAMLAAAKGFPEFVRAQDRSEWLSPPPERGELQDSRALVVGLGGIGRAIAGRLRAFGVEVTGVRRSGAEGTLGPDQWRPRLADFDWVILAAPLTTGTTHVIGETELRAMKRTAWLVNIARGGLIDHAALVRALREGWIGGAYVDATDPEPLPSESPLWTMPNVIVTPHSSAISTRLTERVVDLFLDNLDRFLSERPLRNLVDLRAGY